MYFTIFSVYTLNNTKHTYISGSDGLVLFESILGLQLGRANRKT